MLYLAVCFKYKLWSYQSQLRPWEIFKIKQVKMELLDLGFYLNFISFFLCCRDKNTIKFVYKFLSSISGNQLLLLKEKSG